MECMWHCCFFSPAKVALFGLTVDMLSLFWEVSRGAESGISGIYPLPLKRCWSLNYYI